MTAGGFPGENGDAAQPSLRAIAEAEQLQRRSLADSPAPALGLDQITDRLRRAVDRAISEGSLWAPELAARAIRQTEGDSVEAAQLLRTHRLSLPRLAESLPADTDRMRLLRRIVPAQQYPVGGFERLGASTDYTAHLLELADRDETADSGRATARNAPDESGRPGGAGDAPARLTALLRHEQLLDGPTRSDRPRPHDLDREPRSATLPRSGRLAALARADTTAAACLAYTSTYSEDHAAHYPTLVELRHGVLPVTLTHPLTGQPVNVGSVRVTEAEVVGETTRPGARGAFDAGYGACFGHNEPKAIAMALLDLAVEREGPASAVARAVTGGLDGLEAVGLLASLKLPRHVSFEAKMARAASLRRPPAAHQDQESES